MRTLRENTRLLRDIIPKKEHFERVPRENIMDCCGLIIGHLIAEAYHSIVYFPKSC